eukprot:11178771-Lingulodinium_polyedra.AAC.1
MLETRWEHAWGGAWGMLVAEHAWTVLGARLDTAYAWDTLGMRLGHARSMPGACVDHAGNKTWHMLGAFGAR